ncbi:hypothetical protein, partial [Klebsiella variicola]|uniref:hypothetical protein n=1 Tax=Klebsiella variicola TaxID=244366 RepID=UPI0039C32885
SINAGSESARAPAPDKDKAAAITAAHNFTCNIAFSHFSKPRPCRRVRDAQLAIGDSCGFVPSPPSSGRQKLILAGESVKRLNEA